MGKLIKVNFKGQAKKKDNYWAKQFVISSVLLLAILTQIFGTLYYIFYIL